MIIESIELDSFRNYERELFEFDSETNVIYGDNGQGKTNILEAIYLCSTTRSHKGSKDRQMINFGKDEAHLRMIIKKNDIRHRIDIHLKKNKTKGVALDGIPARKIGDILGISNVVFFSPEDLSIIQDGPEARRRFIDMEICQLDKLYLYNLTNYKNVLKKRNDLLKQIGDIPELLDTLDVWNAQFLEYGSYIIKARQEFIEKVNGHIKEIYEKLTGGRETIDVKYEPNVTTESFEMNLLMSEKKDLFTKTSNVGPHRDDVSFISNKNDLRVYGSRGQQRTGALSLKLTEISILEEKTGEKPILLLDDVLSELDRNRQNYLLESIKGVQTIITCTGLVEFIEQELNIKKKFNIKDGNIID